jgi:predicted dehydrogenase
MKSLIVGMGIGQLYYSVFSSLGYDIDTVDANPEKNATYTNIDSVLGHYNIAVICTPNFTHELIARVIASKCRIVLIEKPGVRDSNSWQQLQEDFPNTRFMMVKNNQYRDTIKKFQQLADQSLTVKIQWLRKNCIPSPGSWFTNKDLSFGGVSRDLLPHMLSYYCRLANFKSGVRQNSVSIQNHILSNITSTDYGIINPDGVYDVDDYCKIEFLEGNTRWILTANWKDDTIDDSSISFDMKNSAIKLDLGWCPEEAYKEMIITAVSNLDNNEFWNNQFEQDLWIHKQLESL